MIAATLLATGLFFADPSQLETARSLATAGQHLSAIAEYQKVLESSPTNASVWLELGNTRMAAGQVPGAIGDYARAVRLSPSDIAAQKALAAAVEKSGNAPRALVEWRRVAQLAQGAEQLEAESHAEAILQSLGQAPKQTAVVDTSKASAKAPATEAKAPPSSAPKSVQASASDPADLRKVVETWKKGERDKALELLRGIIKKSPSPEAYYYGGLMRLEEKKFDMAEFNLKKATSDKTLSGNAWYWLGRTLEARKKPKEAKEAFKKSLDISPKGEFAVEAKARLEEPKKEAPKPADTAKAGKPSAIVRPEAAPPAIADSLRAPFTWYPPDLPFPKGDGSEVGKMLEEAAKQSSQKQNDLALSTLEQLKLKESSSPSAELVGLAGGLVYNAMGLPANAIGQLRGFLADHPTHALSDYAKFVEGICLLRVGKADSAAMRLGPLPLAPKGALWTESARQSALGEALRLSGKHKESVAALKLAFDAETDARSRRSLALRLFRGAKKAAQPEQASTALAEAKKTCDKSGACLQVAVSLADLQWQTGKAAAAQALYEEIAKTWPNSAETPWALYQVGTTLASQGKRAEAQTAWKNLLEHHPGSYWAGQARLRLEDAVWQSRYREAK
ncbi:MAG TPA: tetratricopeptide repeat protein [Fibrobacteria bacterium]|nr:tetratricopeptide repeat protein [Fibrobacteria bacterium]HOX50529.1 tetratricopeptide repeat protein [Fibrobacteria bacterium]